jgi:hypothetical protein
MVIDLINPCKLFGPVEHTLDAAFANLKHEIILPNVINGSNILPNCPMGDFVRVIWRREVDALPLGHTHLVRLCSEAEK